MAESELKEDEKKSSECKPFDTQRHNNKSKDLKWINNR